MPWHWYLRRRLHARCLALQWQQRRTMRQQRSVDIHDVPLCMSERGLHRHMHPKRQTMQQQQQPDLQRQRSVDHHTNLSIRVLGGRYLQRAVRPRHNTVFRHHPAKLRRGRQLELADRLYLCMCQWRLHGCLPARRKAMPWHGQPDL